MGIPRFLSETMRGVWTTAEALGVGIAPGPANVFSKCIDISENASNTLKAHASAPKENDIVVVTAMEVYLQRCLVMEIIA